MKIKQTITEKIFSNHCGKKVKAGDYIIADLDYVMAHDTTTAWAIDPFLEIAKKVFDKNKILIFFDHAYPSPSVPMAELQAKIRRFAQKQDLKIITDGVCHQVLAEKYVKPGDLILGADSHTPTSGALGAITVGVGSTDAAIAFATGKCWFKVPETIKIEINGKMPKNITAKDIILRIAKDLGPEGGRYKAIELTGEVIKKLDLPSRLTLTNMCAELGAKAAVIEPDQKTIDYLKTSKRLTKKILNNLEKLKSDLGSRYFKVMQYDISGLAPQIACPHEIDNVVAVKELEKKPIKVDQVFIGSCTNGRIEDLEIVYKIFKKNKVKDLTKNNILRTVITPASKKVFKEALKRGYVEYFNNIGAVVTSPGCGACLGRGGGVLADGEICVATTNRNFQGRMGSPKAQVYLASPATAAMTAIRGYIATP
jgi:3-isopropylmalate/(R)-2-methylmalate dehydratase large subunit